MPRRRPHRRRWGTALAAMAMTAWLVAVLGSEQLTERTDDADSSVRPLLRSLTGHATWTSEHLPTDSGWALVAKVITLLLVVGLMAWLAASAGTRTTAFMAGWVAAVVACAAAGLAYATASAAFRPESTVDGLVAAVTRVNQGVVFGAYTGWLVGMAIAAVAIPTRTCPAHLASRHAKAAGRTPEAPPRPPKQQAPPPPAPVGTWPPRPPIGTVRPNPAWTAAGLGQGPHTPPPPTSRRPPTGATTTTR